MSTAADVISRVLIGTYAVGLAWKPLIARGVASKLALGKAKEEGAKHFVHDGTSNYVGLAYFPKDKAPKADQHVYAFAAMAAKACPSGEAIYAIKINRGGGWWIGASVDGQPVADTFVPTDGEARQATTKLLGMRKGPMLFGDPDILPNCFELQHTSLERFMVPECLVREANVKLPKWIGPALLVVALGLAGKLLILPYWNLHHAASSTQQAAPVDPIAEWKRATQEWIAATKKPTGADLRVLREWLYALPTTMGGWDLDSVSCSAASNWRCSARFVRPAGLATTATNRTFDDARPKDWKLTWKGASEAVAAFDLPGSLLTQLDPNLHLVALPQYQVDTYSELQEISKIFSKVEVADMKRAEIPTPTGPDGQPVPRPDAGALPEIFQASVAMTGPLRNIEMLELARAHIFWREVTLNRVKVQKPTLVSSEFQAVFRGDIYAKDR